MSQLTTLNDWLAHLETIHPLSMDFKLSRITEVYKRLRLEPIAPLIITVAGTNGKGSTATTAAHLFKAHGAKVGLFTSPHIERFNERIQIDLTEASDTQIIGAFEQIEEARGEITLTYFEFATLAAFYLFKEEAVDVAILEVGLGGRLDSTNIVDADIAMITPIGIDHTAQLGNTLSEIAGEKAGIIKENATVISSEISPDPIIPQKAAAMKAHFNHNGAQFSYRLLENVPAKKGRAHWEYSAHNLVGGLKSPNVETIENSENSGPALTFTLPAPNLIGRHQYQNAASAITALLLSPYRAEPEKIIKGLQSVRLEGRFQPLTRKNSPSVYLDVTHNAQGAGVMHELLAIKKPHQRVIAVLGMLADKDAPALIQSLTEDVDHWITTSIVDARGQSAETLKARISPYLNSAISTAETIPDACKKALVLADINDIILVFGSFHMMAESLIWFKENHYV